MHRLSAGAGLLLALAACSRGSAPTTGPAPTFAAQGTAPTMTPAQPGTPGVTGRPAVDSAQYVRTTPPTDPVIKAMWTEGMERSQAMSLAQVLMDSIGPRLVNSDRYNAGQEWLVKMYSSWGVQAKREQWGTWNSWKRGTTHLDLIAPRVRSLEATMLAWSPGTGGKAIEGAVVLYPKTASPEEFAKWAEANAKGKFVLMSAPNPSCRSTAQWTEFGAPGARQKNDSIRADWTAEWADRTKKGGNQFEWTARYGVAGVITTNWSQYPGIDKVFGSWRQRVPFVDVTCEDYNLLFRLAQNNQAPRVRFAAESQFLGENPVFNVIGTIPGSSKANEYIILSAHYDSWDGGSGATDNGTGTIMMMEAMRILKKTYPNPKRTIIVGHWGGEEQGLNGSRSWVEDNMNIVSRVHAGWNQDNGTGRIASIGPGPFPAGTDALTRYLKELPSQITGFIRLGGTGGPATGGTDNASFQCAKSPVYGLGAVGWDYGSTTWHTNRDTYDKLVPDDLKNNATLVAMLTYMADQDPTMLSHDVIEKQVNPRTNAETAVTYSCQKANRNTAASPR